jgi:hypothetical protein
MLRQFIKVSCRSAAASVSLTRNLQHICAPSCYYATATDTIELQPKKQTSKRSENKSKSTAHSKSVDIEHLTKLWDNPGQFTRIEILQLLSAKLASNETVDKTVLAGFCK